MGRAEGRRGDRPAGGYDGVVGVAAHGRSAGTGVDEKMEEARDSAPPMEEEAPQTPQTPRTPRTPPPAPHLTLVFVGLDGAGKTAVIRARWVRTARGSEKAYLTKERSARPRPRWR